LGQITKLKFDVYDLVVTLDVVDNFLVNAKVNFWIICSRSLHHVEKSFTNKWDIDTSFEMGDYVVANL
jgi:hypothetical protein